MIDYNNSFKKSFNLTIDNYDFLKRVGTLYYSLIDLLDKRIDIVKGTKEKSEIMKK